MIGQTIAHYRVVKLLGRGSMGAVYEAVDEKLDMRVALKVVTGDEVSPDDRARLLNEAQVMASLNHRFICSVHLVGEDQERLFIVMELVEGSTLAEVLADGPLAPDRARTLLDQLAAAMSHAHGRGVIHRDLKPANIMLTAEGEPRIMDFGLAVRRSQDGVFGAEEFGGTLAYIAPEQTQGHDPDELTDIWSLGVVWYEMLTGRRPFAGDYTASLLYEIAHGTAPPLAEASSKAAPLQPLLDRLLARDRAARLRSMDAVREALRELDIPSSRRRPMLLVTIVVLALALVVPLIWPDPPKARIDGPSVAVLPLETHSDDRDLCDFATGFSGEVIAELSRVSDLRVIAQSSMRVLADQELTPTELADRLGVDHVVGGTVRETDGNLHISAELVDAHDNRVMWAESYDAAPSSALILQASVARAVATTLKGSLDDREERDLATSAPIDPAAYRAYVRAVALLDTWGDDEIWQRAIKLLRDATTLEPTYAPAWAALARVYHSLAWFYTSPEKNYLGMCRAAVDRAMALDPQLAAAHVERARLDYMFDQDFDAARAAFARALELAPGDAWTHLKFAGMLEKAGECDRAVAEARLATELSPLEEAARREYTVSLINCRRFEDALAYLDEVADLASWKPYVWRFRASCWAYLGDYARADAAADSAVSAGWDAWRLAPIRWLDGRRDEAWAAFGGRGVSPDTLDGERRFVLAILAMLEGHSDEVLDLLESLLPDYEPLLMYDLVDPVFDPIREDPRFIALTEAMNMTAW
jgi:serine/threonine-protein kinase